MGSCPFFACDQGRGAWRNGEDDCLSASGHGCSRGDAQLMEGFHGTPADGTSGNDECEMERVSRIHDEPDNRSITHEHAKGGKINRPLPSLETPVPVATRCSGMEGVWPGRMRDRPKGPKTFDVRGAMKGIGSEVKQPLSQDTAELTLNIGGLRSPKKVASLEEMAHQLRFGLGIITETREAGWRLRAIVWCVNMGGANKGGG